MQRELLDDLPSDSPEAAYSRKDLIRLNTWMGNANIVAQELTRLLPPQGRVQLADIGCGDGSLLLQVLRRLSSTGCKGQVTAVDQQHILGRDCVDGGAKLRWTIATEASDVFEWATRNLSYYDAVLANLFLHHFADEQIRTLFALLSEKTDIFLAIDPRRARLPLLMSQLVWSIGCNRVTCHDAVLSVRAGFRGLELSRMWPRTGQWALREFSGGFASHVFLAVRT